MKCGDLKVKMNFLISKRFDLPQLDANLSVGRRLDSPIYIFGTFDFESVCEISKI